MKTRTYLLLLTVFTFFTISNSFAEVKTFNYPRFPNGGLILANPNGTVAPTPWHYCVLIKYCTYNVNGCFALESADFFLASSSANQICKYLGYEKSISSIKGESNNLYGQFRLLDENGYIQLVTSEVIGLSCDTDDRIASRGHMYSGKIKKDIYISLTCEK
jgi:hypothetical protein